MKGRVTPIVIALCAAAAATSLVASEAIRLSIGTIVPAGSLWHQTLQYIAQDWRKIVGADLTVRINTGLGDETHLVQKARNDIIDVVGLSSVGLSRIDDGVSCLQVPMMLESYAELDYVRDAVAKDLEKRIEAKGFKVLHWADGGWVYLFTKKGARTPDDLRRLTLWTSAGDPEMERLYKEFGFKVEPQSAGDVILRLQTGAIDAFTMPPLFAQQLGLFREAPHMTDVRWVPLIGGTVITLKAWARLPDAKRGALLESARKAGLKLRDDIRRLGDDSVAEMQKRGLTVIPADAALRQIWQKEAEATYPKLRGRYCPSDVFDHVKRVRDEFRAKSKA
jgi:TRAP-type C4-dicarboxylate transport system substrate-binding protein